jgi:hypothetical protein
VKYVTSRFFFWEHLSDFLYFSEILSVAGYASSTQEEAVNDSMRRESFDKHCLIRIVDDLRKKSSAF